MYSIITKDYVVQFNDEGYASSPLLRSAAVGSVDFPVRMSTGLRFEISIDFFN